MQYVPNMNTFGQKTMVKRDPETNTFYLFVAQSYLPCFIKLPQITNSVKISFFEHVGISRKFVGVFNVYIYDKLNSKPFSPIFHFDC